MHKDDRSYTFFLSHNTKNKIYIRRVKVSKKLLYSGVTSFIISFGIAALGFTFFADSVSFAQIEFDIPPVAQLSSQQNKLITNTTAVGFTALNYERPASSENFTVNSGGPAVPFRLTAVESEAEENEMENQLRLIETTSNPAFLPTMWAHLGKINNEFGFRRNPFGGRSYEFHPGMDIGGEKGDIVIAPANGIVTNAGWQGGYGNMIEVDHGNGLVTRYGHLSQIGVQVGDVIQRGQVIGLIGSTGRSTGPHLHFELRLGGSPINPRRFLPLEPPEIRALNAE